MKKIVVFVMVIFIVVLGIIFLPKVMHTCDDCGNFFMGVGYEPNVLGELLSNEKQIICKDCAEEQHAVSIALGKSIDDFKYRLF